MIFICIRYLYPPGVAVTTSKISCLVRDPPIPNHSLPQLLGGGACLKCIFCIIYCNINYIPNTETVYCMRISTLVGWV